MSTFVSVGNAHQPFTRLLDVVKQISPELPQPVFVQHGHTPFNDSVCVGVPFLSMDEFEHKISEATMVILHAGGGGVLLAVQAGKVPVIVPRRHDYDEHVDNHQIENAHELAASGKVVVADDPSQLLEAVGQALHKQQHPDVFTTGGSMLKLIDDVLTAYAKEFR